MIAYRLVPVEPTEEMLAEGVNAALEGISWTTARWVYGAMLTAAPAVQVAYVELVLIRGLPGSGKTTMARTLALVGYDHHEADHYFECSGTYKFDQTKLADAHAQCLERTKDSLARGISCVVANTFTRRWEMRPYLDAAKAIGVPVRVIEAKGEWENCHSVPADAIERMRRRWESVE